MAAPWPLTNAAVLTVPGAWQCPAQMMQRTMPWPVAETAVGYVAAQDAQIIAGGQWPGTGAGFLPCWPGSSSITSQGTWTATPWTGLLDVYGALPYAPGPTPRKPVTPPAPPVPVSTPFDPRTGCGGRLADTVCLGKNMGLTPTSEKFKCTDPAQMDEVRDTLRNLCVAPGELPQAMKYLRDKCAACRS
jgi:hypothetical protein